MIATLRRRRALANRFALVQPPPDPHEDARRLAEILRETSLSGILRQVFLLRLSRLPPDRSHPHHIALACEALAPLTRADRGQRFRLANHDVLVVWRGDAQHAVQASIAAIRHLFADDPAAVPDPDALIAVLALPRDAGQLMGVIQNSLNRPRPAMDGLKPPTLPLDIAALAALEAALAQASMDRFARRRPICLLEGDSFTLAWEHRSLSLDELFETLLPDHTPPGDPRGTDPWLLRRLTRTLDRRMLALLSAPLDLRNAAPFSLDLNVASLLAPEFLRFDAALPADLRGHIVLNLRPEDILADPAAFLFARDFARARDYRLLLHGLSPAHLTLLPLDRLGLDLILLPGDIATCLGVPLPPANRIVLSGTDTPAILAWGRAHGVTQYQGALAAPRAARSGHPLAIGAAPPNPSPWTSSPSTR